jgi:cytochrome bd-type quinol oxidase subunit 2
MKTSKKLATVSAIASNLYLASATYAQTATTWIDGVNEGVNKDLKGWISDVINLAIGLAALVCVAILIASGYSYITAAGDEAKIEKATKSLTYAIVGLVICFISVILVRFVLTNVLS